MLLKVVIVEDEEIIRKGLVFGFHWLDSGCIIAGTAKDGLEGIEVIRRERPDIVVTDIKMPRLSGLEMIQRLSGELEFTSIVLTSYAEFQLAQQAIHLGVTDYLLKPVDEDELAETLQKINREFAYINKYKEIEKISQDHMISVYDEWKIFESARNSMDVYIQKTYEMIRLHYQEKISINEVAEALEVSAGYLSRKLKQTLNTTFTDLLNQYRVKKAIPLLQEGTLRIYEISDQLGFSEYKYFCSVFKKYTDVSPTEFVKNGCVIVTEKQDGR